MPQKSIKTITFYRIEHKSYCASHPFKIKVGPYYYTSISENFLLSSKQKQRPHPRNDIFLNKCVDFKKPFTNYYFGFKNLTQLKKWFDRNDLLLLKKEKFVIRRYTLSNKNVLVGKTQVMFKPEIDMKRKLIDFKEVL